MKTLEQLIAAGRPKDGYALTRDYQQRTLAACAGLLPYGLPGAGKEAGKVERGYKWKRFSGTVRVAAGAARVEHGDAPGQAIPAVLAACLESYCGETDTKKIAAKLAMSAYSDVVTLLFDRAVARNKGRLTVNEQLACMGCGQAVGKMHVAAEDVQVGWHEWTPDAPPLGIVWLDTPVEYAGEPVDAVIVGAVTWGTLFGDAKFADLVNRERATVRTASSAVVGFVSKGKPMLVGIPSSAIEDLLDEGEFDRICDAAYECSGGASLVVVKPHGCGGVVLIPFDWIRSAV